MRVTVTISGSDSKGNPCIMVYPADLTEGWVEKGDGTRDVMRMLHTLNGDGQVWATFFGEGPNEHVHIEGTSGNMHMTDLTVLSVLTEDGGQLIRRLGIER